MTLFYGGDLSIGSWRRHEPIFQQYQFEREGSAEEGIPAQKAATDHSRYLNPFDSFSSTRLRMALHFQAAQLKWITEECRTKAQGLCLLCSEIKKCVARPLPPSAPTGLERPWSRVAQLECSNHVASLMEMAVFLP
jgi:hypothetical protein